MNNHPEMEKYTEIRSVVINGAPDAHNVYLKIDHQSFCVTKQACDDREEAEWFRNQLCIALARMVAAEQR